MKKFRGIMVFVAALAASLTIVVLQLAWNLQSPSYLQSVAERAGTNAAVAAILPEYAASKLPDQAATKAAFAQAATPKSVQEILDSLYVSITHAYSGKTDVVEIDISSITVPVKASGYQIPPGTAFANDNVQVGGLAGVLRLAQKSLLPVLVVTVLLLTMVVLLGIKRGIVPPVRNVLLVTCLVLGGLFASTLVLPMLVSSLVASSGLDAGMREVIVTYITTLIRDAGRYYVVWIVLLGGVALAMSLAAGLTHRAQRPKPHKQAKKPPKEPDFKHREL